MSKPRTQAMATRPEHSSNGSNMTEIGSLIRTMEQYYVNHVVLPDPRFLLPLMLWAVHTHCWQRCDFQAVAYVNFTGPSGSGKSHAIHALGSLCNNFLFIGKATDASLRDTVNDLRPTLGVDECEKALNEHNSYFHTLFNSGYTPGHPIRKMLDGVPTDYEIYCPKMMATVGNVEETLHNRCIVVPMNRHTPSRTDDDYSEGQRLLKDLRRLLDYQYEAIRETYHDKRNPLQAPKPLEGRNWQIWKPLFAICQVITPELMPELVHAATYLTAIKTRRLRSVKDMHKLAADQTNVDNAKLLVEHAAQVVDPNTKYIATTDLIQRLLAHSSWWQGYQFPDAAGKKDVGIHDGTEDNISGSMTVAKMFKLVAGDTISSSAGRWVGRKSAKGYVVAEILEAADKLKKR